MAGPKIKTLFLDIGGVLLTNGWDRDARKRAVAQFKLDEAEFEDRHNATFDTYELGKLSLDEYLGNLLFYKRRSFTSEEFKKFMFQQSEALDGAIDFFKRVKTINNLKCVALSNEPRELNEYRIKKFKLDQLYDVFVSSCYINIRKPDPAIFHLACDLSNTVPGNVLFIDDRIMFVEVAKRNNFNTFQYKGLQPAIADLKKFGLHSK